MALFKNRLKTSNLRRFDDYCNNSERSSSRRFITISNEAPYQMLGTRTLTSVLGYKELFCAHFWLSLLSECLSCCLYVFVTCSTRISWTGSIIGHEPNLLAMSLTSGIAMMLLIVTFRTVHVNPALTLSFLFTGRTPVIRALMYIFVHCLGAVAAITFLYSISIKGHAGSLGLDNPHESLESWQILIVEIVISFIVTLATYATCNYSSYTSAKKYILEQLGANQSSLNLFSSESSCDTAANVHQQRHLRCSITPFDTHTVLPSTSITKHSEIVRGINGLAMVGKEDLLNISTNINKNRATNDQFINSSNNNNTTSNNNEPYLISNHYNQVYDQYNDVMVNSTGTSEKGDEQYQNSMDASGQISNKIFLQSSNNQKISSHRPLFANQNLKISPQLTNFHGVQTKTFPENQTYSTDNSNYAYEYDNHQIYAHQQLRSDHTIQVPIEEQMREECQLLAPNGFSLHVTSGQALIIGLAYTLTSLSGIPASGASLNPARSFGPAFIMNRWDHHWIYWLGPMLGSVIAGFFYEFVLNPTRVSSTCFRPKFFRLSAHDMAKVGSKSIVYQQQHQHQQKVSPTPQTHHEPSTTIHRPQTFQYLQQQHHLSHHEPQLSINHSIKKVSHHHRNKIPESATHNVENSNQVHYDDPSNVASSTSQFKRLQVVQADINLNQRRPFKQFNTLHPAANLAITQPSSAMTQSHQLIHHHHHHQQQQQQQPYVMPHQVRPQQYLHQTLTASSAYQNKTGGQFRTINSNNVPINNSNFLRQTSSLARQEEEEQLDDDLYNVLNEQHPLNLQYEQQLDDSLHIKTNESHNISSSSNSNLNYANFHSNGTETTSDSSQRTNELIAPPIAMQPQNNHFINTSGLSNLNTSDYNFQT